MHTNSNQFLFYFSDIACAPLTEPIAGNISYHYAPDHNGLYPYGTVASYTCSVGYHLVGPLSHTCSDDEGSSVGTFGTAVTTCERMCM